MVNGVNLLGLPNQNEEEPINEIRAKLCQAVGWNQRSQLNDCWSSE